MSPSDHVICLRDAVKEQQKALKSQITEESTLDAVSKRAPKRSCLSSRTNSRKNGRGSHPRQSAVSHFIKNKCGTDYGGHSLPSPPL